MELYQALRERPVVPEFKVLGFRLPDALRERLPCDLQLQVAMLAWRGQSARYLAPEPYERFRLSFGRGSEYPLYFCAVWPFRVHGVMVRHREQ